MILTAGGFEYDDELRDAHLPLPLVPLGHPGNTGDALRLAQQAGASLWHMSAFFGWFAFVHPDHVAGFPLDVHAPSFVYVDADGRRFADETGWEVHDKVRCLTTYLPRRHNHPHMPGHIVFDEPARRAGPLNGIVGTPNDNVWNADNSAELRAGWIKRADTPEELGRAPEDAESRSSHRCIAIQMHAGVATASGGSAPRRSGRGSSRQMGRRSPASTPQVRPVRSGVI